MSIGFESSNLNAAVERVMQLAKDKKQEKIWIPGTSDTKQYLLTDKDQVREYLMARTEAIYDKSSNGVVAQIRDVVYFSIGVVFEEMPTEMIPPPISRSHGRPPHLAYFWQVL